MPVLGKEDRVPGTVPAVAAEALYLANLLILPGLAFVLLTMLYYHRRNEVPDLARSHMEQTFSASLWCVFLLLLVNVSILSFGGYQGAHVWVIAIGYLIFIHAALVVLGAYGLAKAMSGQCWRFPLVGRPLPKGCYRKLVQ